MEVLLPQDGEQMWEVRVIGQAKDSQGKIKGWFEPDPINNTRFYDVIFPNGSFQQYGSNVISDNVFSKFDGDGYIYHLLESIIDHFTTGSQVKKEDTFIHLNNGNQRHR